MTLTHALRTIVLASLASLAPGVCGTAQATLTNLGNVSTTVPTPFQGTVIPAGTFLDEFSFTLPANGGSGYSVLNFPLDLPGFGTFNTLFTTLTLVSDPDGTPFTSDDQILKTVTAPANATSLSLVWGPTAGGSMYLAVGGIANGTKGGLYSGAISVSAVPEPTIWLLMLGGIGLLGWMRVRKSENLS